MLKHEFTASQRQSDQLRLSLTFNLFDQPVFTWPAARSSSKLKTSRLPSSKRNAQKRLDSHCGRKSVIAKLRLDEAIRIRQRWQCRTARATNSVIKKAKAVIVTDFYYSSSCQTFVETQNFRLLRGKWKSRKRLGSHRGRKSVITKLRLDEAFRIRQRWAM